MTKCPYELKKNHCNWTHNNLSLSIILYLVGLWGANYLYF